VALNTVVVLADPLNDFLHPDGKINNLVRESLDATDTVRHMKDLIQVARLAHIPIYYGLHHTYQPGNYDGWKLVSKSHARNRQMKVFEEGSWGAQITDGLEPYASNGDVVVLRHGIAGKARPLRDKGVLVNNFCL
jgi:nicotinamidase-related amidase